MKKRIRRRNVTIWAVRFRCCLLWNTFMFIFAVPVFASNFALVGAPAIGTGGAFTANPSGAWALYWNPGAWDGEWSWDVVFPVAGFHGEQHNEVFQKIDDILSIMGDYDLGDVELTNDAELVRRLRVIVEALDRRGTGFIVDGHAGCLIRIQRFMVGYLALAYGGVAALIDTEHLDVGNDDHPNSIANNNSAIDSWGIIGHQFIIGYTQPLFWLVDGYGWYHRLAVGLTAKFIDARTYSYYYSVYDKDIDDSTRESTFSENEMRSRAFSCDVGISYTFAEQFSFGLVARDINSPRFVRRNRLGDEDSDGITLPVQVRFGVNYFNLKDFSCALDIDISENESSTLDGYRDRRIGLGLEKSVFNRHWTLRAGYYQNIAEQGSDSVLTLGMAVRIGNFSIEAAFGITPSNYGSEHVLFIDETTAAVNLVFRPPHTE